jgi:hypothetical protein
MSSHRIECRKERLKYCAARHTQQSEIRGRKRNSGERVVVAEKEQPGWEKEDEESPGSHTEEGVRRRKVCKSVTSCRVVSVTKAEH